ncbi:tetratricopeptide repeat protein [Tenacibaculum sp. 47A_GOM-205m]|uniref:transcriptional regulator n=1 Tax=Tenacibaculum sp. 47A_GOM-205m TaxID=1380384 RepID=UPI00048B902B|nr:tetratricopeptide repeat protein [Tenacibaculum sp. 47A_GOM-205m]
MKYQLVYILLVTILLQPFFGFSQELPLNNTDALKLYHQINNEMNEEFPVDDIKTYTRDSYSETQLKKYLSLLYRKLDLLPQIEDHYYLKIQSFLDAGNWFYKVGFPKESIKWYNQFLNFYVENEGKLSSEEKNSLIEMHNHAYSVLAADYAKLSILDSAEYAHKANINYSKTFNKIYYPSAINNYGLFFYWNKSNPDKALPYFKKAYEITLTNFPNHTLLGSVRDNIADIYYEKGEYNLAAPLYAENFKFFKNAINEKSQNRDTPRLISAGAQLVNTNIKLGKFTEANTNFNRLEKIITEEKISGRLTPDSELEFLQTKETLQNALGLTTQAYATLKVMKQFSDSIQNLEDITDATWRKELNNATLDRVALNFELERMVKENQLKSQQSKFWIVTLSFSFIILLLASLFLRRRQHIINAKNKQELAERTLEVESLKVEKLNSEIQSKKRDLSDFAINLSQQQEWIKYVADKVHALKQTQNSEREALLNELEQEINNKVTFDADTQMFYEKLDKLSDSFYRNLTTKFPDLSKNEIRLCSLIRLKINSRSIATLQNITLASLNTSRYRLRKKLHLTEDINLDAFIQSL